MKKILFSIAFWISFYTFTFACKCSTPSVVESFMQSDFVANVKVLKTYPNATRENLTYRIDIEILDLFKGTKVQYLYVFGTNDSLWRTNCDVSVRANSIWLVYANNNKGEAYAINYCSRSRNLNLDYDFTGYPNARKNLLESFSKEQNELQTLKKKKLDKIDFCRNFWTTDLALHDFLNQYRGKHFDKDLAIYKITFNSNSTVKKVKIVSGFHDAIDKALSKHIKYGINWKKYIHPLKPILKQDAQLLISVHYYKTENQNTSLLTTISL
jgi:DNA-binding cell septation regulator SpoVG